MMHVSLYDDVDVGAKPHVHSGNKYPATVHLNWWTRDTARTREGYCDITPEQADKLADDLKVAAESARKLEAERVAKQADDSRDRAESGS